MVGQQTRDDPDMPAVERLLPLVPALEELLPDGLRRGTTVGVVGSTSVALALGARASATGSWSAAIGAHSLGFLCAAELGYDLKRFVVVKVGEPLAWARAVSALLDPCDVLLAWPPRALALRAAEQLTARARERGAALVVVGAGWPARLDLMLTVRRAEWSGIEAGAGRFQARRIEVEVTGRGAASLARRGVLWLPDACGKIALAWADPPLRQQPERMAR